MGLYFFPKKFFDFGGRLRFYSYLMGILRKLFYLFFIFLLSRNQLYFIIRVKKGIEVSMLFFFKLFIYNYTTSVIIIYSLFYLLIY
jgi:hypothetical protein